MMRVRKKQVKGEAVTREELNKMMLRLVTRDGFPVFESRDDAGTMGDVLLSDLEENWDEIPTSTRAVMLGVAASLKKYYADGLVADMVTDHTLRKMRGL